MKLFWLIVLLDKLSCGHREDNLKVNCYCADQNYSDYARRSARDNTLKDNKLLKIFASWSFDYQKIRAINANKKLQGLE